MTRRWQKATIVVLVLIGLLMGGSIASYRAFAANEPGGLNMAQDAQNAATQSYNQMMTQMHSMQQMPMTANEKAMMKMMATMADTIKHLLDENKQLIQILREQNRK